MNVNPVAIQAMKFRKKQYEVQFLDNAVDAAKSMIIGDSIINDNGKTALAYAAKLIVGSSSLAINAVTIGRSNPINNQLVAKGSHIWAINFPWGMGDSGEGIGIKVLLPEKVKNILNLITYYVTCIGKVDSYLDFEESRGLFQESYESLSS